MTFERWGSDFSSALSIANNYSDCVVSNMVFRNTSHGYTDRSNQQYLIETGNKNAVISGCVFTNNCWGASLLHIGSGKDTGMEYCYIADNGCTGENPSRNFGVVFFNRGGYRGLGFVRNNTIANNKSKSGAVHNLSHQGVTVANNIIWGNRDLDGTEPLDFSAFGSSNSDLYVCNCLEEMMAHRSHRALSAEIRNSTRAVSI